MLYWSLKNKMLKRHAIVNFIFLTIIAILGILLCVCPFSVPYTSKNYNGFINAINKGVDLNGGVSAIYNCTLADGKDGDLTDAIDNSLSKLNDAFSSERFSELYIERQGGNKIYLLASSDAYEMNKAFYYVENGKGLSFTAAQVSDTLTPEVYVNSSDLKSVKADYDYESSAYGITITFTSKGYEKLKNLKKVASETTNSTIYAYLGEMTGKNLLAEIKTSSIKNDTLFITASSNGSYKTTTAEEVRELAYSITGGMLDVELNLIEVSTISAVLGKNTNLYIGICLIITAVLVLAFLCFRYGELGLVGGLALSWYAVLFAFLMQAIPFITMNLAGVIGTVVAFLFASFAVSFVFEKIKEEYAIGKKIHLSCKGGFKKALWPIIDSHAVVGLIALFIWVIAPASMKCFGITLIIGDLLSLFTSLALLRGFVKNYLSINSTKPKRLRLYRDASIKEIREEVALATAEGNMTSATETEVEIIPEGEENLPVKEEVSND